MSPRLKSPATEPPAWAADAVERRAIAMLMPYARNARTHSESQIAQIAASIREWGWTMPVLIDEENSIIAGHARVLAARLLKIDEIPVMVARGWSEAKRRAYVIADNKLALNSDWNDELLRVEIDDLRLMEFDPTLIGFNADELMALFPAPPEPPKDFGSYDENIEIEHVCPKCGYAFSGGKTAPKPVVE